MKMRIKSVVINNTGTVNISGTTNISSTIYKNQTANICLTFLQAHIIFDPTDFVDSEKFTITQSGENWIVAEKIAEKIISFDDSGVS